MRAYIRVPYRDWPTVFSPRNSWNSWCNNNIPHNTRTLRRSINARACVCVCLCVKYYILYIYIYTFSCLEWKSVRQRAFPNVFGSNDADDDDDGDDNKTACVQQARPGTLQLFKRRPVSKSSARRRRSNRQYPPRTFRCTCKLYTYRAPCVRVVWPKLRHYTKTAATETVWHLRIMMRCMYLYVMALFVFRSRSARRVYINMRVVKYYYTRVIEQSRRDGQYPI